MIRTSTKTAGNDRGARAKAGALAAAMALCLCNAGCSVRNYALAQVGDALAASSSGFGSDDDPELIGAAAPFSLKLIESVLAETPGHRGLLLAAAQGFTQYSYAFVEQKADALEDTDSRAAYRQHERAARLYLRARDYGLRGLDAAHPGIAKGLRADPVAALAKTSTADVGLLYWTGAAWAAAISQGKDDPFLVADLPAVDALMSRVLALDEAYDHGAAHVFMISYEMSRAGLNAGAAARARRHYTRAIELTGGRNAAPYVACAEAISTAERNREEFERLLREALKIETGAQPEWRLVNTVMQQRARWLLGRADRLFAD